MKSCIERNGHCCEDPADGVLLFLLPNEIERLASLGFPLHKCTVNGDMTMYDGMCPFFQAPLCTIHDSSPVDCQTYPISPTLVDGKVVYKIDMRCPAFESFRDNKAYVDAAIKLWEKAAPSRQWLEEYTLRIDQYNYVPLAIE